MKQRKRVEVYGGDEWLEVKGEANYQRELASIAGPKDEEGHNLPVLGMLLREPDNEYDYNAIAVYCTDENNTRPAVKVGYVNADDAEDLAPVLDRKNRHGETVALEGFIRGGWLRADGDEGHYGVWLTWDPADFR